MALAVGLTFINDFYLKMAFAGTKYSFITGKLSDFCGLFFFPIFLAYIFHRGFRMAFNEKLIHICCNLTIVLFILFKYVSFFKIMLSDFFTEHLFAISIVSDRSDLLAVVSVVAAYFFLKKYSQTTLA